MIVRFRNYYVVPGVRNGGPEANSSSKRDDPGSELIEVVVTEQLDPAQARESSQAPLAESESEESVGSELDKLAQDEEEHKEDADKAPSPKLQLLPLPKKEVTPPWVSQEKPEENSEKEKLTKIDLSNLKLTPSKASLQSVVDKMVKVPKPFGNKTTEDSKLRFFVGFLFLSCSLLIGAAHVLYYQHLGEMDLFPNVIYEEATRILRLKTPENEHLIELSLGVGLNPKLKPFDCSHNRHETGDPNHVCLEWYNQARVKIDHSTIKDTIHCYNIHWQSLSHSFSPTDCFATGSEYVQPPSQDDTFSNGTATDEANLLRPLEDQGQWYGGGESLQAAWPLQKGHIKLSPFVTGDEGQTEWGNAIRKYFVNSRGVSLNIDDHTPLFVSLNDPPRSGLCLQARHDEFAYYYHHLHLPRLNYTICTEKNLKKLHQELLPQSFWDGHKQSDLNILHHLLKTPIWQVPSDEVFSHEALERYVEKIVGQRKAGQEEYANGYLLLDYHWQEKMGDLKFNKKNFPSPNETVQMIKDHGLKLVLTVSPFISTESVNFALGVDNNIFVSQRKSTARVPALTWFKDVSSCGMLDMTSNKTAMWFRQQLKKLTQDLEIISDATNKLDEKEEGTEIEIGDSESQVTFFLQTGNTFHTPSFFKFEVPLENPDLFREHFVGHVMNQVSVIGVSGASSSRPRAPAFVFLSPLEPKWSHLRSIIPNVLQLSTIGYPFVNPGPVGGIAPSHPYKTNQTEEAVKKELKDELELYIRWWQLNTFLPMLHFVKPPSAFPESLISGIAKSLKNIRARVVLPEMIRAGNEAMHSSAPMIRPLWMIDSLDPITHIIDDQFLIRDTILVAPVLEAGARERNVYLPMMEGAPDKTVVWKRVTDGTYYKGGQWLNGTKVDLHEVLYFVRQLSNSPPGMESGLGQP